MRCPLCMKSYLTDDILEVIRFIFSKNLQVCSFLAYKDDLKKGGSYLN